ncbi:DUF4468 domain-containing protein [Pedobacter nototheniae]|uniref:DUF4468 domain-containing protein n=1 Tax=Pedobacter nototheniae TaxID=2488994 RepID=UPI00103B6FB1|nr:DUF4468 domain-containing protein [Pedobacter nototheniae]
MKKTLNLAILLLVAQLSFAQYFKLTDKGFVSTDNTDFTVVNVPNIKQKDLYKNVLNAINSMYSNPQKGLNVVDGESISITAYEEKALPVKHKAGGFGKTSYKYDLSYTLSFLFKDGKIRINRPTFECRRWYEATYRPTSGWSSSGWTTLNLLKGKNDRVAIYDTNGELLLEEAATGLNNHFNALLKQIIEKSQNINNW